MSNNLFKKMLYSILRSPLSWFDTTPSGRILNRTNKDQDEVDNNLSFNLNFVLISTSQLFTTLLSVLLILPYILIPVIFIGYYLTQVQRKYLGAAQNFKRVQSQQTSPFLNLINEASNGYQVIRAYKKEPMYQNTFDLRYQRYQTAFANVFQLNRWMAIRTDFTVAFFVGVVSFFGILSREINYTSNSGLMGMAISRSFGITFFISFFLKCLSDFDLNMNAVERILDYIHKDIQEKDWDLEKPPTSWPVQHKYEAQNVRYKYRPELPEVIKGIHFSIKHSEKIGVVGRTGSGKSTLTLGLLRMLELAEDPETHQPGTILLDDQDISKIGLHHLRSKTTIIPQDPFMFSGTIRSNLDPFSVHTNEELIDALQKTKILDQLTIPTEIKVSKLQDLLNKYTKVKQEITQREFDTLDKEAQKLYMVVEEGGNNLSLGQRQLLCMARALVRKTPVLVMDEATANIDELNDYLIQQMIKNEFKSTTVITIAHRLNTIIHYDRIMVMQEGHIMECDSPKNLLNNQDSLFYKMVSENGQNYLNSLKDQIQ